MYTLFRVFPPNQRGTAMGFFGMSVILGPALGPTLGGVMIEHFNWRYIFYVAVPVAALGDAARQHLHAAARGDERAHALRLDRFRAARRARSRACSPALSNGQREGWHSDYIVDAVRDRGASRGSASSRGSCTRRSRSSNLRVLANGQFTCAAMVACLFGVGLFGSTYLVPLFVQTVQGYTAFDSGLLLMPGGLIMGLFMPIGGLSERPLPARGLIIAGLVCFVAVVVLARVRRREQRLLDGRGLRDPLAHRARADQAVAQRHRAALAPARSCSGRAPA